MITYREYCKTIREDWGKTSPIPKEVYADVKWEDIFHWIDPGLPSGTLWADANLYNPDNPHGFWSWDEIMNSPYKDYVPTLGQIQELSRWRPDWKWSDERKGMVIRSGNGNELFLPAEGRQFKNKVSLVDLRGYYWSTSAVGSTYVYNLSFNHYDEVNLIDSTDTRYGRLSIRLVKKKIRL